MNFYTLEIVIYEKDNKTYWDFVNKEDADIFEVTVRTKNQQPQSK